MNKNITKEQFNNCHTLANYLDALPDDYDKFSMGDYMEREHRPIFLSEGDYMEREHRPIFLSEGDMSHIQKVFNECGTSACACGHGILAGIHPKTQEGMEWEDYAEECFVGEDKEWNKNAGWDFVFNYEWSDCPKEAAARLRIFADSGVPKGWNRQGLCSFKIKYT